MVKLLRQAKQGKYPLPHRIYIPKPGSTDLRPLTIPCTAHRIRSKTIAILLRPHILEHPEVQHAFRPFHSTTTCWQKCLEMLPQHSTTWEFDFRSYFPSIPHGPLETILRNNHYPWELIHELLHTEYTEPAQDEPRPWPGLWKFILQVYDFIIYTAYTITRLAFRLPRYPPGYRRMWKGLLQGLPTSPWLSMLYLEHQGIYQDPDYTYLGYADDGLIFSNHPDPEVSLLTLKRKASLAGLELKPSSVHLVPATGSFQFLGLLYDDGTLSINSKSGYLQGTVITIDQLPTLYSPQYSKWCLKDSHGNHLFYSQRTHTWHYVPRASVPTVARDLLRVLTPSDKR